jgi:DNA-binding CsgD family transcriptional regulator
MRALVARRPACPPIVEGPQIVGVLRLDVAGVTARAVATTLRPDAGMAMRTALSPREAEILERVASGGSSKEIAAELSIAESTVNWHVGNVLSKLNATNRTEAVAITLRGQDDDSEGEAA